MHYYSRMRAKILYLSLLLPLFAASATLNASDIDAQFEALVNESSLMGLAVEITHNDQTIYKGNFGYRDYAKKLPFTNDTVFRMASLSKSMTASGLMLLVQEGKVKLTDSLESILGFRAVNPNFPNIPITLQMILTHQSSLIECDAYDQFLTYSTSVKSGADIPNISTLFIKGERFYNQCTFSATHPPGTYYQYVNLNFVLAGTVLEKVSGQRFDIYMRDRIFSKFSDTMTFNLNWIKDINDVAVLYEGSNGTWVPQKDNFNGVKPAQFNMTGYVIGTNAVYYGPQGSVRASVSDLNKFMCIFRNRGFYNGSRVIPSDMIYEMIRPRYQFHGLKHGALDDNHAYGFGLFQTTYRSSDRVWLNENVVGHTGSAYGLASGMWFSGNYTVAYAMNGALNGYHYVDYSIYSIERQAIANITYMGIKSF